LDGRKMSKSYDNTVPLFEGGPKALKDAVARIVTDSRLPGEPKDPEGAHLVTIFDAFADAAQHEAFRADLRSGLAWGEAKQRLVDLIEAHVGPMRANYAELVAHPERIEAVLQAGADKARARATPFLKELRHAVGLRRMVASSAVQAKAEASEKPAVPVIKQYREADGQFYFKLTTADGALLIQSQAYAEGREAGALVKRLKTEGAAALVGAPVALAEGVSQTEVDDALAALVAATEAAAQAAEAKKA
jgi:tryptophanyl-tRNA synthetase